MLKKNQSMDPTQQSAAEYYKKHRKHSLFSRITIISSMTILRASSSVGKSASTLKVFIAVILGQGVYLPLAVMPEIAAFL